MSSYLALLILSLFALLMLFAAAAIFSVWPGGGGSAGPDLGIPPAAKTDLGDAVAVAPGERLRIDDAAVAADASVAADARGGITTPTTGESAPATSRDGTGGGPSDDGRLPSDGGVVSPGRAVQVVRPVSPRPPASPPAAPQPVVAALPPQPAPAAVPVVAPLPPAPTLVANFENGFDGWSRSVLSDSSPRVVSGVVRDGARSSLIRLTGDQSRSQLVLGGEGGFEGAIQVREGDEYAFAFSFYIQSMIYGKPGVDNLLMLLRSDLSEDLQFGLQLWDFAVDGGGHGLWSSGAAVTGDRFLGEVTERAWHDVIVHFRASAQGTGFYDLYVDGRLVDARDEVSLIAPGSSYAQIEVGLFRDDDLVQGTSEIRIDAARLGQTLESVLG